MGAKALIASSRLMLMEDKTYAVHLTRNDESRRLKIELTRDA